MSARLATFNSPAVPSSQALACRLPDQYEAADPATHFDNRCAEA